nr:hypothetical protein Iba_chr15aCG12770 [Ipomoea batatas]
MFDDKRQSAVRSSVPLRSNWRGLIPFLKSPSFGAKKKQQAFDVERWWRQRKKLAVDLFVHSSSRFQEVSSTFAVSLGNDCGTAEVLTERHPSPPPFTASSSITAPTLSPPAVPSGRNASPAAAKPAVVTDRRICHHRLKDPPSPAIEALFAVVLTNRLQPGSPASPPPSRLHRPSSVLPEGEGKQ